MFGDMMGMMNKLKEAQQKVEETKERLNTVLLDETSSDGLLKVTITANRTLKSISIDDHLLADKEQLEDYLILTINKAIDSASAVQEAELGAIA
ncbi:MAG: YbaB/EbfC family nucleoid-associated protein, partial [Bacteroidetes bacterium]|nr:YbaB/EbfC family nucleoid-associated protein [Bacteroidota bacterium]